jgi:ADP-heptose:LPS heptosyltransferase
MHALFSEQSLPQRIEEFISKFDLAVSWIRSPALAGHLESLGVRTAALKEDFPPPAGGGHVTFVMSAPVRELGVENIPVYPRLEMPAEVMGKGPEFPGIIVHPGSGSPHKNWPVKRFARAARRIAGSSGQSIALLEGPADAETAAEFIKESGGSPGEHYRDLDALELSALLASARLVLGNDSGVSHLAGALGAPVVAVYGPTDPVVWGVRQPNAAIIAPRSTCAPCRAETMRACKNKECMESVTIEEVVKSGLGISR